MCVPLEKVESGCALTGIGPLISGEGYSLPLAGAAFASTLAGFISVLSAFGASATGASTTGFDDFYAFNKSSFDLPISLLFSGIKGFFNY